MALIDDLKAYWSLDESSAGAGAVTREDSHGSNDLTDTNTVASGTGVISNGADFETSNSEYLTIADNADLSFSTDTPFTIACWVKFETVPGTGTVNCLICKGPISGNTCEFNLFQDGGTNLRLRVGNNSSNGAVSNALSPSTGVWYFVVAWHDPVANTINVSVNDGAAASAAWTGGTFDGSGALSLAASATGGNRLDGMLDEVGIWHRVLDASERTDLYNAGAGRDYAYISGGGGTTYFDTSGAMNVTLTATADAQFVGNTSGACDVSLSATADAQRVQNSTAAVNVDLTADASAQRIQNSSGAVNVSLDATAIAQGVTNSSGAVNVTLDASGAAQRVENSTGAVNVTLDCAIGGFQMVFDASGAVTISLSITGAAERTGDPDPVVEAQNYFAYVSASRSTAVTPGSRSRATTVASRSTAETL